VTTTAEFEIVQASQPKQAGFEGYVQSLIHLHARTLTALGFTLVPLFFILDFFMMPPQLLERFAVYHLVATALVLLQHLVIRNTRSGAFSELHGYLFTLITGGMFALMTTDLSGFNSTYYAGLNLVMIATNTLLPWRTIHSAINCLLVIGLYLGFNLAFPAEGAPAQVALLNNAYFLVSTALISVAASTARERLVREEFRARSQLKAARDALWGDMEVAKRIQTSLLPRVRQLPGYHVAATMVPAEEVGGDYYDVIETPAGELWVSIGDVSGHGVESGLIMMMTQTSVFTAVSNERELLPSRMLERVNGVLVENIARLGADRYLSISALTLRGDELVFSGKHQDILVYRHARGVVEVVPTTGTWLGVLADLRGRLSDHRLLLAEGDVVLLFTDGVTEATNAAGQMYGEKQLERVLHDNACLDVETIVHNISRAVQDHMEHLDDDLTLIALKRVNGARSISA
jgi:phosphoserine phosphatase RsbU/P